MKDPKTNDDHAIITETMSHPHFYRCLICGDFTNNKGSVVLFHQVEEHLDYLWVVSGGRKNKQFLTKGFFRSPGSAPFERVAFWSTYGHMIAFHEFKDISLWSTYGSMTRFHRLYSLDYPNQG